MRAGVFLLFFTKLRCCIVIGEKRFAFSCIKQWREWWPQWHRGPCCQRTFIDRRLRHLKIHRRYAFPSTPPYSPTVFMEISRVINHVMYFSRAATKNKVLDRCNEDKIWCFMYGSDRLNSIRNRDAAFLRFGQGRFTTLINLGLCVVIGNCWLNGVEEGSQAKFDNSRCGSSFAVRVAIRNIRFKQPPFTNSIT